MDDDHKALVDRLDKVLDDSRTLGRLGTNTMVTFAAGIIGAKVLSEKLLSSYAVIASFTIILLLIVGLWLVNLTVNLWETEALAVLLQRDQSSSLDGPDVLSTRLQYRYRWALFWQRIITVVLPLFLVWLFLTGTIKVEPVFGGPLGAPPPVTVAPSTPSGEHFRIKPTTPKSDGG